MCEPNHSIVQFPPDDPDSGSPNDTRMAFGLQQLGAFVKKVSGWFHLSKLGKGHSESVEWAGARDLYLPDKILYEAQWWSRTISLDSWFPEKLSHEKDFSLEVATRYANSVSIGNLTTLRNFLEVSLKNTDRSRQYVERAMEDLFNKKGKTTFYERLKLALGSKTLNDYLTSFRFVPSEEQIERITKVLLGLTRRRELLCPAWSDDKILWEGR